MYDNALIKSSQQSSWKESITQLTNEFVKETLQRREIKEELKPLAAAEMLMYLDMLIVSKVRCFPITIAVNVSKHNLKVIKDVVSGSSVRDHDIIRMCSIRQDFYRNELVNSDASEDTIRTVGMQWFQFPFQAVDGFIRPSGFDFSVYFSDNYIVSDILFDLAPRFADKVVNKLKEQYSAFLF